MLVRFAPFVFACALTAGLSVRGESMRIGIETNAEPMSFVRADGTADGFTVDMIQAIAAEMKFDIVPVIAPWEEVFAQFRAGKIDALVSLAYTKERDQFIDFAVTHLVMNGTLFVRKGDRSIRQIEDMATRRLAVQQRSFSHEYAIAHHWDRNLLFVESFREAMRALDEGRCDAVAAIDIIGASVIQRDRLRNVEASGLSLPGFVYELHMGVHAGDADRLAILNEGLARIRANGRYDAIYEKWIGPLQTRRIRIKEIAPYLIPFALVLAASFGAFVVQRRLLHRLQTQAEALRQSEERLRLVLEASEHAFWDWDMVANRLERSDRWASMLGYSLAEISADQQGGRSLIHPDDLAAYDAWLPRLQAGENRYEFEYRMRTKSGEWRWILDRGKVVARAPDGTPLRMAGTHTDITARKRTEEALAENRELFARTAHILTQTQAVAHIGGWELDLRTQKLFWTEETYRLHDTTPAEFQPTIEAGLKFYTPPCRELVAAARRAAIEHGTPYDLELDLVTAKGRPIRVQLTGRAEWENGRVVKVYGSFRDITQEKAAEADRQKIHLKMLDAQRLESLGVLAGGIAHDFNNLLTVILANANFARETSAGASAESLAAIETAAHRASDLCRQMLAYAGQTTPVFERIDLGHLVQETAHLLLVSISKKAELHTELAPELPPVVGDISQLRQVVMNLVINASEALGDAPGAIRVRTRRGRPEAILGAVTHTFELPPGDCVCLEVTDTGCGMDAATLGRVFDPFFTTKFTGRGLGLAATLGIVRTHHGALVVTSTPGRGSTFQLFLGAAQVAPAPAPPAALPPKAEPAGGRILLVDDEEIVRRSTDVLLRARGYETVLACDGVEALEAFRQRPNGFTLVLLDLTMPRLDGAEVMREIRRLSPATRVLVMSGFSEQEVRDKLRGLGPIEILHKPFTLQTLLARLTEVIAT